MATFTQNITNIKNARYGKDVRNSIAEAIEQAYAAQAEFDDAYRNAITELNQRIQETTTDAVNAAISDAVSSAQTAVLNQQTTSVNAVNDAKTAALQDIQSATGSTGITLSSLGLVYSATEPSNPTTGMVWLKPVE